MSFTVICYNKREFNTTKELYKSYDWYLYSLYVFLWINSFTPIKMLKIKQSNRNVAHLDICFEVLGVPGIVIGSAEGRRGGRGGAGGRGEVWRAGGRTAHPLSLAVRGIALQRAKRCDGEAMYVDKASYIIFLFAQKFEVRDVQVIIEV